jgi:hypothetical protein
LRQRELLSLEVEQVDFNLDVINMKITKSGKWSRLDHDHDTLYVCERFRQARRHRENGG